ncbi:hypothetical protein CRUP_027407 [Coryphaenoides rupestris]|nr:hypothetical protein CRUP_027407 [Coryphaenoides rupestris]
MNGTIYSPAHPGEYPNFQDCMWMVRVPPGYGIYINFSVINTEPIYDYITAPSHPLQPGRTPLRPRPTASFASPPLAPTRRVRACKRSRRATQHTTPSRGSSPRLPFTLATCCRHARQSAAFVIPSPRPRTPGHPQAAGPSSVTPPPDPDTNGTARRPRRCLQSDPRGQGRTRDARPAQLASSPRGCWSRPARTPVQIPWRTPPRVPSHHNHCRKPPPYLCGHGVWDVLPLRTEVRTLCRGSGPTVELRSAPAQTQIQPAIITIINNTEYITSDQSDFVAASPAGTPVRHAARPTRPLARCMSKPAVNRDIGSASAKQDFLSGPAITSLSPAG